MESKIEQRLGQWHGGKGVITDIEINVGNCDFVPFSLLVKNNLVNGWTDRFLFFTNLIVKFYATGGWVLYIHTKIYLFFYSDRISSPFQERLTLFMKVLSYNSLFFCKPLE